MSHNPAQLNALAKNLRLIAQRLEYETASGHISADRQDKVSDLIFSAQSTTHQMEKFL